MGKPEAANFRRLLKEYPTIRSRGTRQKNAAALSLRVRSYLFQFQSVELLKKTRKNRLPQKHPTGQDDKVKWEASVNINFYPRLSFPVGADHVVKCIICAYYSGSQEIP